MPSLGAQAIPSFDLKGRRALITGGSRGIGLAAAYALAGYGSQVTLLARPSSDLSAAVSDLTSDGFPADALELDVTDIDSVESAIAARSPYDILLNCAGTNHPQSFVDVSQSNFDSTMNLNLRATFFTSQAVAKRLIAAGMTGSIINVSSQMGHVGAANRSVYCASKWALEGLTKSMAIDLAKHGIRVNTICPTFVVTPLTQPFLEDPEFKDQVLKKIKLGRLGEVGDFTGAIVYLASNASSLMTGTSMIIDGGWTAD